MIILAAPPPPVFRIADPRLTESSSLVDLGAVMVSANDSGHPSLLFVLDPSTGETRGTVRYAASQVDVEALAPAGRDAVWVGDIGDNLARRRSVVVHRVPLSRGPVRSYRLRYPDGAHDAEALAVVRGRLTILTKGILGGHAYAAPRRLDPSGVTTLQRVGPTLPALVTDAAAFPDGRHLLVRTYDDAYVYAVPVHGTWRRVGSFPLPRQPQGESVSIGPHDRVRIGSEGVHSRVLSVTLPRAVRARMRPAPATPTPRADASAADAPHPDPAGAHRPGETRPVGVGRVLGVLVGLLGLVGLAAVLARRAASRP
ncbi:MAG: hypothetical protein ACTHJH_14520 [Marmoricola sp.]